MANNRSNRDQLIEQLMSVFQQQGYDGATLNRLAAATGLGKASLYHHFPGGKDEIAQVLVRHAVANLERLAFSKLNGAEDAATRLRKFLAGFADYVEQGRGHCLLAVLVQGGARPAFQTQISAQFEDWHAKLAMSFEEMGAKPKRADRAASQLLEQLYGSLLMSKIMNDPKGFQRALKRIRKRF